MFMAIVVSLACLQFDAPVVTAFCAGSLKASLACVNAYMQSRLIFSLYSRVAKILPWSYALTQR